MRKEKTLRDHSVLRRLGGELTFYHRKERRLAYLFTVVTLFTTVILISDGYCFE